MSRKQEVQELYGLLRSADAKAQAGDEQARADAQAIYDHIQSLEAQTKEAQEGQYPAGVAAGLGVGTKASVMLGKKGKELWEMPTKVAQAAEAQTQQAKVLAELLKDKGVQDSIRGVANPNAGSNWTKAMTGISPAGSNMSKASMQTAEGMKAAIAPGGEMPGGSIHKESIILPPDLKSEKAAQVERMLKESSMMGKLGRYGSAVKNAVGPVVGKAMPWLNAASLPFNAAEAYNRGTNEDPLGAGISAIGTAAGAASLYPPLAVPAGLVSLGAAGTNWALDEYRKRKGQEQTGSAEHAPQYAIGGLVYLRNGGQPPKSNADESAAFIGYPHVNRNRKIGSGTGFLDALVGAPPSRENILNPSDYSYMQGYEKGEPYGIAGMVLPIAGMAKRAIYNAMPPKVLNHATMQFLHGTSPAAKADILASGKFDPHPARWPSYSYSEIGADTTYATPKEGWWLDKQKAMSGRAQPYESAVGVDIDPSAKIAHIRNPKDWEKFARHTGFKSGQDLYRQLGAENLDSYNYAKNLTPQQFDQLAMERIQLQKWLDKDVKPGDFHYQPPEYWEQRINEIPTSRDRILNERSITEPRAAVQKIKDKGYHGLYVGKHDEMGGIPAPEQLAIFDQNVIRPNADIGYATGGSVPHYQAGKLVRSGITDLANLLRNERGITTATRLERAADLIPNLESQYTTDALREALSGGNRSGLMVLNPNDFQKFAVPLSKEQKAQTKGYRIGKPSAESGYANLPWGSYDEYIKQLQGHVQPGAGGFTSVPYFQLANEDRRLLPEIYGHEGRHRTEALAGLGEDKTLVKINPIGELKGQLGGETNQEFLENLKKKFGNPTLVRPESSPTFHPRDSIELPELFKKGGKATHKKK